MAAPAIVSARPTDRRPADLRFGIIALTDCSPIVMAHEHGFFKKFGIDATVSKEASRGRSFATSCRSATTRPRTC